MGRRQKARKDEKRALEELRALAQQLGGSVSVTDFRRTGNNALYADLLRRFGSIEHARERAGIAVSAEPYKWTRERIIAALRDANRNGIRVTGPALKRAGKGDLLAAAEQHFGGLPRARAAAGVASPPFVRCEPEEWTTARVIQVIQERHRNGESLASSKVPASLRTAARVYCGSWREAVEKAGFEYAAVRLVRQRYSRAELVAELLALCRARPRMTITQLQKTGFFRRCMSEFGTLSAALQEAGIEHWPLRSRLRLLSREEALAKLRWLHEQGQDLRRAAVRLIDPHLVRSIDRNFDLWTEALAAIGVTE